MTRVLLLCLTRRGGLLHFNDCLAEALSRHCEICLLCAAGAEHPKALTGVEVRTLDTGKGMMGTLTKLFAPATWKEIRRVCDEFQPDLIHVTSAQEWNPALGFFIKQVLKKPLLYTIHDVIHHESTPLYFKITESLFRGMPDAFVVLTEQGKQILCSRGIPSERVLVIPHGVYDFFTRFAQEIAEQKEILFFGRIEYYKGVDILLEAARPLLDSFPDWKLRVAGSGDITPYTALLQHLQIEVCNRFLSDEEVAAFMQSAAIVALPYRSASQSGVIPTAFAFGKAVAATAVGGIPDMIHDGETGLLVPPNDPAALREALRRLMSDDALRHRLGQGGLNFAQKELSWEAIAEKQETFYREFLKNK